MSQENRSGRLHPFADRIRSKIPSRKNVKDFLVSPTNHNCLGFALIGAALFDLASGSYNRATVEGISGIIMASEGFYRGLKQDRKKFPPDETREKQRKQNKEVGGVVKMFNRNVDLNQGLLDLGQVLAPYEPDELSEYNKTRVQEALIKKGVLTYTKENPAPTDEGSENVDITQYYIEDDPNLQYHALLVLCLLKQIPPLDQKKNFAILRDLIQTASELVFDVLDHTVNFDPRFDIAIEKYRQFLSEVRERRKTEGELSISRDRFICKSQTGSKTYNVPFSSLYQKLIQTDDILESFYILQDLLYYSYVAAVITDRKRWKTSDTI